LKPATARALTYFVVGALAFVALRVQPYGDVRQPGEMLTGKPVLSPLWRQSVDTLARGQTLSSLFERGGLTAVDVRDMLRAAAGQLDERRIPAGMQVKFVGRTDDTLTTEVILQLAVDRFLKLTRGADGWSASEERLPWTTDTVVVAGRIMSTLYEALDEAAGSVLTVNSGRQLAWSIADILEYRVDMSRDLQVGDAFRVLVERSRAPGGLEKLGNVLSLTFNLSGSEIAAVRFESKGASGNYFDAQGKSLRAAFLRAPLEFRRISSVFGKRWHPVLGGWRQHKGTDYAAASGSPVRAIGDGTIVFRGWRNGYGNTVEIRHRNGYVTRYAHLRGFADKAERGRFIGIGQTLGYVGQTGYATGPHLHFEADSSGIRAVRWLGRVGTRFRRRSAGSSTLRRIGCSRRWKGRWGRSRWR
jgi:murein DD-endopeptidase MepM/ murein hydrolase activator NlpD